MGAKWKGLYSDEFRTQVADEYESGDGLESIAERHHCSTWVVKQAVLRRGGEMRSPGPSYRTFSPEVLAAIVSTYVGGKSQTETAAQFGIHQTIASRILRQSGVHCGRARGPRNPRWKGGRRLNAYGYVEIWGEEIPFPSMRRSNGYVLEHRLVMAQSLGRALLPTETVHHRNGTKDDNRLENLELRLGPHGNGSTIPHCPTCTCC